MGIRIVLDSAAKSTSKGISELARARELAGFTDKEAVISAYISSIGLLRKAAKSWFSLAALGGDDFDILKAAMRKSVSASSIRKSAQHELYPLLIALQQERR